MKSQKEIQNYLNFLVKAKWVTLSQTVPYMSSKDYKDRMTAEALQLTIRINKLSIALKTRNDPLMIKQLEFMKEYLDVLTKRMEQEGWDG